MIARGARLLRSPLRAAQVPPAPWLAWHLAGMLLVLLVPSQWRFGEPLLALPVARQLPAWAWALAYLGLVASLHRARRTDRDPELWMVPLHAAGIFGAAYLILRFGLALPPSRTVFAASLMLAMVACGLPALLGRALGPATAILAGIASWLVLATRPPDATEPDERVLVTNLLQVTVREYRGLVDSLEIPGGALARVGNGFLLVTGEGEFYRLSWDGTGDRLVSRRLPLTAELNRAALRQDVAAIVAEVGGGFPLRTNDLALDTTVVPHRIYLAHSYWHAEDRCLAMRVSVADLPADSAATDAPGAWSTIYESVPCLPPSYELRRGGTGSRLAWLGPDSLLLTIGDHGVAGPEGKAGPQDPDSPYGKVLLLDRAGRGKVFTQGHRNAQGLVVGRDKRVWSTEHGPQGGDELNFLVPGGNYGWPLATYGVQYGQEGWPLAGNRRDHGDFLEPALAFVPSLGISNLIEVGPVGFPAWDGDLLVSSLRAESLVRVRTRGDRVIYQEPIPIGHRIRDLEQGSDGRVLLWTDGARLLVLERAAEPSRGARAYAACAGCHGALLEGTPLGPPLRGVVGREVAAAPGFEYSTALRNLGGEWTGQRLDLFLRDPAGLVPGTSMVLPGGIPDSLRFLVIEYLRHPDAPGRRAP